jgi:hypothetical protein
MLRGPPRRRSSRLLYLQSRPLLAAAIDMGIVPPEVVVYRLAQVILTDIAFNTECDDEDVVLPKTCKPLI